MAHYLGDTIQSTIVLMDAAGNRITGAVVAGTISANLYNPLDIWDGAPAVTEIAGVGMYRCEFTKAASPGNWKVLWACTSPVVSKVFVYDYRDDPSLIAAAVWGELFAGYIAAGTFGKLVQDILAAIAALNDLSIADIQTALTNQGYTAGRAVLLDNLDAATTAVLAAIAALNDLSQADVQAAMTAQGYTAIRAVLLDNLDAAISGVPAAVDAVLSAVHGAGSWATSDACDYHAQPC